MFDTNILPLQCDVPTFPLTTPPKDHAMPSVQPELSFSLAHFNKPLTPPPCLYILLQS